MSYLFHDLSTWLQHYHPDLSLDSNGYCYLNVASSLTIAISVTPDKKRLALYCPLLAVTEKATSAIALEALSMNLYQSVTAHGTLGYDAVTQQLVYTTMLSGETVISFSEASFRSLLSDFISNSQKLVEHFEELAKRQANQPTKPAVVPPFPTKLGRMVQEV